MVIFYIDLLSMVCLVSWGKFDAVSCFYIFNAQASPCKRTLLVMVALVIEPLLLYAMRHATHTLRNRVGFRRQVETVGERNDGDC